MSGSRKQVRELFAQGPCNANRYIIYDESLNKLRILKHGTMDAAKTAAYNKMLDEYDAMIKTEYGEDHFHGEEGLPLGLPFRMMEEAEAGFMH